MAATVVTAAKANDGFVRMCGCFTIYALWPINGTWCLLSSFFSLHRRHFLSEASWSAQNNKRRGNLVLSSYACIHAKGREIFLWKFPRLSFNKKSSQPKTLSGLYLFDGFRTFRHRINNEQTAKYGAPELNKHYIIDEAKEKRHPLKLME